MVPPQRYAILKQHVPVANTEYRQSGEKANHCSPIGPEPLGSACCSEQGWLQPTLCAELGDGSVSFLHVGRAVPVLAAEARVFLALSAWIGEQRMWQLLGCACTLLCGATVPQERPACPEPPMGDSPHCRHLHIHLPVTASLLVGLGFACVF